MPFLLPLSRNVTTGERGLIFGRARGRIEPILHFGDCQGRARSARPEGAAGLAAA